MTPTAEHRPEYQSVTATFDNRRDHFRVQKSTLDAMGRPRYLKMLVSRKYRSIVLMVVGAEYAYDWDTIVIPDKVYQLGTPYGFTNRKLMPMLREFTGWLPHGVYRLKGICDGTVASFDVDEYDIILGGKPLRVL